MKKVLFFIAAFLICHAVIGQVIFSESFDGTFPPAGWNNIQVVGTGLWTGVTSGTNPTCSPHSGAGMANFDCYDYYNNTSALLVTPVIDLSGLGAGTATISFWMYRDIGYPTLADSVDVYVSNSISPAGAVHLGEINRNINLSPVVSTEGWYKYSFDLPSSFNTATNYIIFKGTSLYGNNIFIDDVNLKIGVANDAGIISIDNPASFLTTSGVMNVNATIENFGMSNLTSAHIAWTVNGASQTPFVWSGNLATAATNGPLTLGTFNFVSGYYTVKVWTENPNGAADGDHTNDTTTMVVYVQGYAPLPFSENFDSTWINKNGADDVPTSFWQNTPATGNQSWRRDDDGASANWTGAGGGSYTPAGAIGSLHSARFHSYEAAAATTGTMDAYLDFTTPGLKILKFSFINPTGSDSLDVYISHDGGSTFAFLQEFTTSATWVDEQIALGTATDAQTVVRFKATSDFGTDDIGIDNVKIGISQLNDAGVVSINSPTSPASGVTNVSVTIENFGANALTSANIDWSVNGTLQTPTYNYTNGTGLATNVTDGPITIGSYNFLTPGNYTIKAWTDSPNGVADGDNTNDTISKVVYVQGYAALPFSENFESTWVNKMDTRDVPSLYWENTPATGSPSWRRDDDGTSASWNLLSGGTYTPSGADGSSHSARFHSYGALSGSTGTLDVYLDFTTAGIKGLKFSYINPTGADSLDVYISHDGGSTYNFLQQFNTSPSWTDQQIILGHATDAQTIIRFKATSDFGNDDIGIDNVIVSFPAANDVGVTEILSPKGGLCGKAYDSVKVIVTNFGTASQIKIPVIAKITTPGGPVTLSDTLQGPLVSNASDTLFLGFINTLTAGTYSIASFTDLSADSVFTNDTTTSAFAIAMPLPIPHLEDFEGSAPLENWNTDFYANNGHGNTSNVLYTELWSANPKDSATMTEKIGIVTANSFFTFDYRITDWNTGTATILHTDSISVSLSNDCGATFHKIILIDSANHVPSTAMRHIVIPIGSYAGDEVIPSIYAKRGTTGDYYVDFDNIAISESAVVNLGPDTSFCPGSSFTLDAGAAPGTYIYSYAWSTLHNPATFATTQTIAADSAATYIVAVDNGYGVITSDTVALGLKPVPSVSLGHDTSACISYLINAGAGYSSYTWSTGDTAQTITVTSTNTYIVTVTNSSGCTASSNVTITIIPFPTVYAGPDQANCYLDSIHLLNAMAANFVSLLWKTDGDGHFNDTTILHPAYLAGYHDSINGIVHLTLKSFALCDTVTSMMTYHVHHTAYAFAGDDRYICKGSSFQLSATGGTSYHWKPSASLSDTTIANPIVTPDTTTTYFVTVTSSCGTASDSVIITPHQIKPDSLGPDLHVCPTITLDAGTGYSHYLWSNNDTTQITTAATTGEYYITVTDSIGCHTTDSIHVLYYPMIITHVTGDVLLCDALHDTLHVDSGYVSYLWKGLTTIHDSTDQYVAGTSGKYWVQVSDTNGCTRNSDTLQVYIFQLNNVNLGHDTTIYLTEFVILDAGHGYDHYSWSTGANTQTFTVFGSDLGIGNHKIWVTAWMNEGCISSDTIIVHVLNNVGITEYADNQKGFVYPNPATNSAEVIMPSSWKGSNVTINLTDLAGRTIRQMKVSNAVSAKLDLEGIAPGMYQIILNNGAEQSNIKLIVE